MQVLWTLLRLIRSSESPSYKSSVAVYLQEFLKSKWEGMAPLCELQVFWSSVRKSSWKSVIQTALWQSHGVIRRRGPIFQEDPWGVHCVYRDDFEFVGSFLFNCTHPWPGDCVSEAAAGSWAQSGCVTLCCVFPAGCGCVFLSPSGEAAAPDRGQPQTGDSPLWELLDQAGGGKQLLPQDTAEGCQAELSCQHLSLCLGKSDVQTICL